MLAEDVELVCSAGMPRSCSAVDCSVEHALKPAKWHTLAHCLSFGLPMKRQETSLIPATDILQKYMTFDFGAV